VEEAARGGKRSDQLPRCALRTCARYRGLQQLSVGRRQSRADEDAKATHVVGKVDRSLRGSSGGSFPPDCVSKLFPADSLDERSHSDTEGTFLAHELN